MVLDIPELTHVLLTTGYGVSPLAVIFVVPPLTRVLLTIGCGESADTICPEAGSRVAKAWW